MAKRFSKSTETRDELQLPAILMLSCLSAPDATSLDHCLKNKQLKLVWFQRLLVVKSLFLVLVLFREVFSHPYISFFHLLVWYIVFQLLVIIIVIFRYFFRRVFSECTEAITTSLYQ